jgi:hypothetical protein
MCLSECRLALNRLIENKTSFHSLTVINNNNNDHRIYHFGTGKLKLIKSAASNTEETRSDRRIRGLCTPAHAVLKRRGDVKVLRTRKAITAVPNTKLHAWGEEDSGEHVL